MSALRPAAEQLLRHHSEEESDWSDGESETKLKLSQEFERQACLQSRHDKLNDNQEREVRLKHSTIEISWLLIHQTREAAGKL